jgi:hypothetical protein
MNQRSFYPVLLIMLGAAIFLMLPILNAPALTWTVFGVLGIALVAVIANLLYAFIALELGYYPGPKNAEHLDKQPSRTLHHLRGMLHVRLLRHH